MKIQIEPKPLSKALETLRPVFSSRLLACDVVFLRAKNGHLYVSANNAELYACIKLQCEIGSEGEAAVNGLRLLNATSISKQDIGMELSERTVKRGAETEVESVVEFKSGNVKAKLATTDPANLPAALEFHGETKVVDGEELKTAINKCLPFVGGSDRPALMGIHFEGEDIVATTGRFLGTWRFSSSSFAGSATIPEAGCRMLRHALGDGQTKLGFSENAFKVETEDMQIIGAVIADPYPNCGHLLCDKGPSAEINVAELLQVIPHVSGVHVIEGANIISLHGSADALTLSSRSNDEASSSIAAVSEGGFCFSINAKLISVALGALDAEGIKLVMAEDTPTIFFQENKFRAAVLRIRTETNKATDQ